MFPAFQENKYNDIWVSYQYNITKYYVYNLSNVEYPECDRPDIEQESNACNWKLH